MNDLGIAVGIMLMLASMLFRLGLRCGQSSGAARLAAGLALIATFACVMFIHGRLFLAGWFPYSNIIVFSNLLPLAAAFLAGVVQNRVEIPSWRRVILITCLLVAGWLSMVWTTTSLAQIAPLRRFLNGVCIQSVPNSCSACSAVTLLGQYGIMTDEAEMARLCLTTGRGTQLLGIYRGLKLKTAGTQWDVEVVQCDFDQLLRDNRFPILVPLRQDYAGVDEVLGERESWWRKLRSSLSSVLLQADHCVVLFGVSHQRTMVVGDPSNFLQNPTGRSLAEVRRNWRGVGFRIVARA